MSVLILKNVSTEGPGTIEDFLREQGIPYRIVELEKEAVPHPDEFDTLVMMGGPMSVNEEEIYPYIKRERELVKEFIAGGKRVFGVCLGAQIMAKALGAEVYVGPEKEIGWYEIELTEDGIRDPLMKKLAVHPRAGDFWKRFRVFHWHGETFDVPSGAVRLAKSALYPNQAFRYGNNAYAFQFHIEVKKEMIYEWLKDEPVDRDELRKLTEAIYEDYAGRAMNFYKAFLSDKVTGS
ncbi:MAG: type 1 glutamine amidotransferase [Nitrospirae bacterium]|nr:type 1 glutamine amidotransferase [Nitrospirota bacterium]MCL5421867.1 type 1 glutamine amidotransferase [Nitrospirota bacterium]